MIEVDGLEFRVKQKVILSGVSFRVPQGARLAVLGRNGAGKSSVLKILSTLVKPTHGQVRIAGHDVARDPIAARRVLGVVFQEPVCDELLTVRENLEAHGIFHGLDRVTRAARIVEVATWLDLETVFDERVGKLSPGSRQRVELARAFLHEPRVVLLDEPTTGVDMAVRRMFWNKLDQLPSGRRPTIFLATHAIEEAARCDRVAIIDGGAVVAEGTPRELCRRMGTERVVIQADEPGMAIDAIRTRLGIEPQLTDRGIEMPATDGAALLARVASLGLRIKQIMVRRPTLEDAFVAITGHRLQDARPRRFKPGEEGSAAA